MTLTQKNQAKFNIGLRSQPTNKAIPRITYLD